MAMVEADDEEEAAIDNVNETGVDNLDDGTAKAWVVALQQEAIRKNDYQSRLIRKLQRLDADLAQKREEVEGLQRTLELERSKQMKQSENDRREREQKALLQAERIRDQLSEVLYQKPKDNDPKATFDMETVVVSYVTNEAIRYNLTFRLDSETTVEQLRTEACKYWGVDNNEYILTTMGNSKCHSHLKVKECFKHGEIALLRLGMKQCDNAEVSQAELKAIQPKQPKNNRKGDKDAARLNKDAVDRVQKFGENYTMYLNKLGGVYFMLKLRDQKPSEHAAKIKLRDFILFFVLAIVTLILYVQRRPDGQAYWFHQGLVDSLMIETAVTDAADTRYTTVVPSFANISSTEDLWWWLNSTLPMVIWGRDSGYSTRDYSTLPGFFSIRVQNVKEVPDGTDLTQFCSDSNKEFVATLPGAKCYYSMTTNEEKQDQEDIPSLRYYWDWVKTENITDPEIRGPSTPWRWKSAEQNEKQGIGHVSGRIRRYDASGYMVDYRTDIVDPQAQLFKYKNDLVMLRRRQWIGPRTRVVIIEFSVYNYQYDLWASCLLMVETPPGGKPYVTHRLSPFKPSFSETRSEVYETYLEVIRCLFGLYIVVVIGIAERRHKTKNHKAGARYYASLNGIVDVSMSMLMWTGTIMRFILFSHKAESFWAQLKQYNSGGFYSTEWLAEQYDFTFKIEGAIFCLIMYRLISLFRLSPMVYLLWHTIGVAVKAFVYLCFMAVPAIVGFAYLAMQVWGQHFEAFESLPRTLTMIYNFYSGNSSIVGLLEHNTVWSAVFCVGFFVVVRFFLINTFVTLMIDAYYIVRLTCNIPRSDNQSTSKWFLQWAFPSVLNSVIQNLIPQSTTEGN